MSLDQHIYGSTDWHLPSPSSTPKSLAFPDSSLKTPKTEVFPQSHFLDAWATPHPNGQHTPVQTPSFAISTPIDRPLRPCSQPVRPEDPEFHVNHFAPQNLPLPPVEVSRRLSSSPDPNQLKKAGVTLSQGQLGGRPVSMDFSQMQTPPPTRDATSRRSLQHSAGNGFATPATVIHRTPTQVQVSEPLFDQTPFGFGNVQYTPDMMQFPSHAPMSAPPMPQSRLFWDPANDGMMNVDSSLTADPFGPTPHRVEQNMNWQAFDPPGTTPVQAQLFHGFQGMSSGPMSSFQTSHMEQGHISRPSSFVSTSAGVDPSMLFSFSNPDVTTSFGTMPQATLDGNPRLPYETQMRDAQADREKSKKTRSQHSRSNTNSSSGSAENVQPSLYRSNTDSGMRNNRPLPAEPRMIIPAVASTIPRRSSPLKRGSGGSLKPIPEIRRPRTRLFIDETGRARTETISAEDNEETPRNIPQSSQQDLRHQYPGLYEEDDSESEEDEPAPIISRNNSFVVPQPERRAVKHARTDSGGLERSNSFKMARPASRPSPDKASFGMRPVRKPVGDNASRRFSMIDAPSSMDYPRQSEDQQTADSPGDALGALKKVVAGRQQRIERATQNTLKAHNQRWAQASADIVTAGSPHAHGHYDPFSNSFNGSPTTTHSTDRSSTSSDSTRCICNGVVDDDNKPMVQCESCNKWLHMGCVGVVPQNLPPVYVCVFCTGTTPVARGGRLRGPAPLDSPLTHKAIFRR